MAADTRRPDAKTIDVKHYQSETEVTWCPGCGDFGVLRGLLTAAAGLRIEPHNLVVVSGIGCSSNLPHFTSAYGFHSLHGRAVPLATGARLANPGLTVVVTGGDGDGYGIGVGHFIHAMRRNLDITYIVMNNQVYGLTTGQCSPTTERGRKTKSTPEGTIEDPVNPIALALAAGATYIARGFSGDPKHMADLIQGGIAHRGFALIDVFSPCVTFNRHNTYKWFRERVYKLDTGAHDTASIEAAFKKSLEWGERIPIGLFYQTRKPTYEEEEPAYEKGVPARSVKGLAPEQGTRLVDELI